MLLLTQKSLTKLSLSELQENCKVFGLDSDMTRNFTKQDCIDFILQSQDEQNLSQAELDSKYYYLNKEEH